MALRAAADGVDPLEELLLRGRATRALVPLAPVRPPNAHSTPSAVIRFALSLPSPLSRDSGRVSGLSPFSVGIGSVPGGPWSGPQASRRICQPPPRALYTWINPRAISPRTCASTFGLLQGAPRLQHVQLARRAGF